MRTRELSRPPAILPLYARAAAPLLPGASLLPFLGGRGNEIPELELTLADVTVERDRLAAYAHVCGFSLRETLPATYPHVLAFPLHLALMADPAFPFGAVGLVHIANRIELRRPIDIAERLQLRVCATPLQRHPRGRSFSLVSEARVGDELVWEGLSTMLRRGSGGTSSDMNGEASSDSGQDNLADEDNRAGDNDRAGEGEQDVVANGGVRVRARVRAHTHADTSTEKSPASAEEPPPASAQWRLPGDLGRRYAAVSGDRNPIHMHALTAKALGFSRAIAHGMWTKARCLAALESLLPDAYVVEVRFRRPIELPATVAFAELREQAAIDFEVRDAKRDTPHLHGNVGPLAAPNSKERRAP